MIRKVRQTNFFALFFLIAGVSFAQDQDSAPIRLAFDFVPRIVSADEVVFWEQAFHKESLTGIPIVLKVNAENIAVRLIVTGFQREKDILLVVQSEVTRRNGVRTSFRSSVQSLTVPEGEKVLLFPLGRGQTTDDRFMVVEISAKVLND